MCIRDRFPARTLRTLPTRNEWCRIRNGRPRSRYERSILVTDALINGETAAARLWPASLGARIPGRPGIRAGRLLPLLDQQVDDVPIHWNPGLLRNVLGDTEPPVQTTANSRSIRRLIGAVPHRDCLLQLGSELFNPQRM